MHPAAVRIDASLVRSSDDSVVWSGTARREAPVASPTMDAVVRAYTDVGLRTVLAPAVADVVFYRTVPGLLELLPGEPAKSRKKGSTP